MTSSIYSIAAWAGSTSYVADDIVSYQGLYYYAKTNHTSSASFDATLWDGTILHNGITRPYFFWVPSYNSNTSLKPKVKVIKFGDGYEQRSPDGISNNLLNLELNFDLLTQNRMAAITHFLNQRGGVESFLFVPQPPFSVRKLFVCREIPSTVNFYNNHSMRLLFEETVN